MMNFKQSKKWNCTNKIQPKHKRGMLEDNRCMTNIYSNADYLVLFTRLCDKSFTSILTEKF